MSQALEHAHQLKHKIDWICTAVVGGLALLVYLLTISSGVFPGQSASLMVTYSGIEPQIAPAHPLWGSLVRLLAGTPVSALRLNLFSAICGVFAVILLYRLVSNIVYQLVDPELGLERQRITGAVLAGCVAATALAFSVPFWMVSTRLHYQTFDLLLLLVLTHIFARFYLGNRLWLGLLFALLCGITIVESVIVLPLLPLFIILAIHADYRDGQIRLGRLTLLTLFGLLGLGFFALVSWRFCQNQDLTLRGYHGFGDVLRTMIRDQLNVARSASRVRDIGDFMEKGLFLIVMPWLATIFVARRALNRTRDWVLYLFHIAITLITLPMLGNAPFSPWGMLRGQTGMPIALTAMLAVVSGYLVAYWYRLFSSYNFLKREKRDTFASDAVGAALGYSFLAILLVMVAVTSIINGFEASGRRGAFADECAREMLDQMEGRTWLVTDGMFDDHFRIEAARRKMPLKLLALHKNDNQIYIRQMKRMIDEDDEFKAEDKIRYKNVLDLGVVAFLQDWMTEGEELASRMAIMNAPDLIIGAGWTVAPLYFGFVGVTERDSLKDVDFVAQYTPFWERMGKLLARSRGVRDPVAAYRATVRRQVGFVANNTGVLLEDLERRDEAYQVYKMVRQIDVENISALLNMAEILNRDPDFMPGDKEQVEKELRDFVDNMARRLPIWSLSRYFGYVRSPVLFAQLGWTWALSGQPGMAMAGLRRAEAISPSLASRTRVRSDMADIFIQQGEDERGAAIYEEILKSEPDNQRALLSMARIETRRGAIDKARAWLERAAVAGTDRAEISLEQAAIDLAANQPEQARIKLQEITELQPKNLQALGMLAICMLQMRDFDEVERRILPRMESVAGTPDNYLVQITRGQLAYQKGKEYYRHARDAFERASVLRPGLPMLLEWVLRLDFLMDDKAAAEVHAHQILRINRNHGFANYIMGSLMMWRGRRAEAEDYLRRSVRETRSAAALNDLAELLRKSGNFTEAEEQARAAIELSPDLYFAWDTLGGILADTQRWDDAEKAYAKALEIFKDDLRIHLNLAKLLTQKRDLVRAREIISRIQPRRHELPPAEQEELDQLVRELTPRSK